MRGSRPAGVHKGSLVRVGVCNEAIFAVDVVSDALWYVAPEPPGRRRRRVPVRFVNSHLDAYLQCLCAARPALDRQPDEWVGEDRIGELERLRQELESIDRGAFTDPDSYWPVIFSNATALPAKPRPADVNRFIQCFGRDNLRTYSDAALEAVGLSGRAAALLTSVGLPRDLEPYIIAGDLHLMTLDGLALQALHPEGFVRLGWRGEANVAVDKRTHEVWLVDADTEPCFVNSDLNAFLSCACHVSWVLDGGTPGFPIPGARTLVARLRKEVGMIDERAFARDNVTYWSVIFEELEYEVA